MIICGDVVQVIRQRELETKRREDELLAQVECQHDSFSSDGLRPS